MCFPGGSDSKESSCNTGDLGSILRSRRFPGVSKWLHNPIFSPGELHGQRNLEGLGVRHTQKLIYVWQIIRSHRASLVAVSTESACNMGNLGLIPGLGRSPWRREWQPTPLLLLGEFQGQRSLAVYSPWDHKELDTAE